MKNLSCKLTPASLHSAPVRLQPPLRQARHGGHVHGVHGGAAHGALRLHGQQRGERAGARGQAAAGALRPALCAHALACARARGGPSRHSLRARLHDGSARPSKQRDRGSYLPARARTAHTACTACWRRWVHAQWRAARATLRQPDIAWQAADAAAPALPLACWGSPPPPPLGGPLRARACGDAEGDAAAARRAGQLGLEAGRAAEHARAARLRRLCLAAPRRRASPPAAPLPSHGEQAVQRNSCPQSSPKDTHNWTCTAGTLGRADGDARCAMSRSNSMLRRLSANF